MAKDTITVTNSWVKIAVGVVVVTVKQAPSKGALMFNETASDTDAHSSVPPNGRQFLQNEVKDTYVRAALAGASCLLTVDGTLT